MRHDAHAPGRVGAKCGGKRHTAKKKIEVTTLAGQLGEGVKNKVKSCSARSRTREDTATNIVVGMRCIFLPSVAAAEVPQIRVPETQRLKWPLVLT